MKLWEVAWIVGGAVAVALIALFLPDWQASVAYGIGIFVGSRMTRSELRRRLEQVRR